MPKRNRHPITGCRVDSLFEDVWLISPEQLNARVQQIVRIDLNELVKQNAQMEAAAAAEAAKPENQNKPKLLPYQMLGGTAIVEISGITTKYPTSFQMMMGGTSTVRVQRQLAHALQNPDVQSILLHLDGTPGGNAAGAFDLADDIRKISEVKPIWAHISDQGTSAGMLFASQARWISANKNAQTGSIGVLSKLEDTSKMYEAKGIRVIPIIAGKMKGVGMDGVKISEEQIREVEAQVEDINNVFVDAVATGRGISGEKIRALEARTFIAERAKNYGLVDQICQFDHALAELRKGNIPERKRAAPQPEVKPSAAPRSRNMLKPEQLVQAKGLPGAAHITAENADEVLLQTATSMQTELGELRTYRQTHSAAAPAKISPSLAQGHISLYLRGVEYALKEGKVTPGQRDLLKNYLQPKENEFNLEAVSPNGTVLLPVELTDKLFEMNKPNGVNKDLTGNQPAPRQEPGAGATGNQQPLTLERINANRAENQLAPITKEEFEKTYGTQAT